MILKKIAFVVPFMLSSPAIFAADLLYDCKLLVTKGGSEVPLFKDRRRNIIDHQQVVNIELTADRFGAEIRIERGRYQSRIKDTKTSTTVEGVGAVVLLVEDGEDTTKVRASCAFDA